MEDFQGRDVIVSFYPKDDTPGCTKEACGFRDAWKALRRAGVAVVGISADTPASHTQFAEKSRLPFSLLSDPGVVRKHWAKVSDAAKHPAHVLAAVRGRS